MQIYQQELNLIQHRDGFEMAWGDVTGMGLDISRVKKAREEEMHFFKGDGGLHSR